MLKNLFLVTGKPGSGKSSASALAAAHLGDVYHFSLGEELRARAIDGKASRYTQKLRGYANELRQHKPVPAEISALVVEECIETSPKATILVDGYPQYADRLPGFHETIDRAGAKVIAICGIEVPDATAIVRLSMREQRSPDIAEDEAYIARRLDGYYKNVVPTIETLRQQYPYHPVDGSAELYLVADSLAQVVFDELQRS